MSFDLSLSNLTSELHLRQIAPINTGKWTPLLDYSSGPGSCCRILGRSQSGSLIWPPVRLSLAETGKVSPWRVFLFVGHISLGSMNNSFLR